MEEIQLKLKKIHSGVLISQEMCTAINNILHVQQSIIPLAEKLDYIKLKSEASPNNPELLSDIAVKDIDTKLEEIYAAIARLVITLQL